jgi:hypothetical protein
MRAWDQIRNVKIQNQKKIKKKKNSKKDTESHE